MKLAPLIVSAKAPIGVVCGAILLRTGIGFSNVTVMLAEIFESAALTALTVAVFGLGRLAGDVYIPAELIAPVTALPPLAPFTNQFTEIFAEPVTDALNCWEAPNRTLAEFGEINTVILEGGELGPPEPNWTEVQTRSNAKVRRRTISLRVQFEGKRVSRSVCPQSGFSRTGTLACPRVPQRFRTGQIRVSVLPSKLNHYHKRDGFGQINYAWRRGWRTTVRRYKRSVGSVSLEICPSH